VYSWGNGDYGRLGGGDRKNRLTPKPIQLSEIVVQICAGENHSGALTSKGKIYTWGDGLTGQLGNGVSVWRSKRPKLLKSTEKFFHLAVGNFHTLAISEKGQIYSWGSGDDGQLGHHDFLNQYQPKAIAIPEASDIKFTKVFAGERSSMALTTKGVLYSWGKNSHGQLGTGDTLSKNVPTIVKFDNSDKVYFQTISSGWISSLALTGPSIG